LIAVLEKELGSPLFERLGRGVKLTTAQQALREPARRALRSFEVARGAVRSVGDGGYGRLSIITNTLWAVEPLAGLIGEFRRLHPAVEFTVTDPRGRYEVLEKVRIGDHDFGLVDGTPPAGTLESRWLADHQLVAVPPRTLTGLTAAEPADLVPLGLISTPRGTALREYLDDALQAAGEPLGPAVETAHLAQVIPLVLAGAGAALLPEGGQNRGNPACWPRRRRAEAVQQAAAPAPAAERQFAAA
jgi:DNA-binding transcriptional LysR family regulator